MAREYDVPLAEAQIIWDPADDPDLPSAEVVALGYEDDGRYHSSWGACNQDFVEASPLEQVNMLMRQFVHMVAIDGADPKGVHQALMMIPEYRAELVKFGSIDSSQV